MSINKWFTDIKNKKAPLIDKWVDKINKRAEVLNTKAKHISNTIKQATVKNIDVKPGLDSKTARKRFKKNGPEYFIKNVNVTALSQNIKKLWEGNEFGKRVSKIAGSKWGKLGIKASLVMFAGSFLYGAIRPNQENSIPKNYERGYHLMNETMTDFGSPVSLAKAAQKVIVPYYSSIRNNVMTSTAAITNNNIALAMSAKAIGHTKY